MPKKIQIDQRIKWHLEKMPQCTQEAKVLLNLQNDNYFYTTFAANMYWTALETIKELMKGRKIWE